jgi:hypothetical protein
MEYTKINVTILQVEKPAPVVPPIKRAYTKELVVKLIADKQAELAELQAILSEMVKQGIKTQAEVTAEKAEDIIK